MKFEKKIALKVCEAAELLGVSKSYMYQLIHIDGFPAFKIGNRILISYEGLNEWILENAKGVF